MFTVGCYIRQQVGIINYAHHLKYEQLKFKLQLVENLLFVLNVSLCYLAQFLHRVLKKSLQYWMLPQII